MLWHVVLCICILPFLNIIYHEADGGSIWDDPDLHVVLGGLALVVVAFVVLCLGLLWVGVPLYILVTLAVPFIAPFLPGPDTEIGLIATGVIPLVLISIVFGRRATIGAIVIFTAIVAIELRLCDLPSEKISTGYAILISVAVTGALILLHRRHYESIDRIRINSLVDSADQVQASEGKFRLLAENSVDVIWKLNLQLKIEYVSPSCLEVFGWAPEEMLHKPPEFYMTKEAVGYAWELLRHQTAIFFTNPSRMSDPVIADLVFLRKDGSSFPVEISCKIIRNQFGIPTGISGSTRDISQRRKAEEVHRATDLKLRALFEQSLDAIYIRDEEGHITDCNPAMLKLFGYEREELIGMNVSSLYAVQPDRERLAKHKAQFGGVRGFEVTLRTKYDDRIECQISTNQLSDQGNIVLGIQGTIRDVTQSKHLEEQLRQAQKMEMIGRLAGGVAHDFNNLLMAILGNVELALDEIPPDHKAYWCLREIKLAGERSSGITKQLLGFARKQPIVPLQIDMGVHLVEAESMMKRLIGEAIDLRLMLANEPLPLMIDPTQIDQILINLCVNARDAIAETGEILIMTGSTQQEKTIEFPLESIPAGDYITLSVTDNGCGMSQETLSHIYEPFFTTKPVGEGTGLGLATVFGIVKQNFGFIKAESVLGLGSTFTIYLPALRERVKTVEDFELVSNLRHGSETILLVEDELAVLEYAKNALKQLGYNVIPAADPNQAAQVFKDQSEHISLLITDVVMPKMNGALLAQQLRNLKPEMKVIFISGYGSEVPELRDALDSGAVLLQKPFTIRVLAEAIRNALETDPTSELPLATSRTISAPRLS